MRTPKAKARPPASGLEAPAVAGFSEMPARDLRREAIVDVIASDRIPSVPSVRATTGALAGLTQHGYSDEEIWSLVVPKRTLARRIATDEPLTVEETDKALRLERIAAHADRVFGDPAKGHRWLRKAKRALGGETPLAFLASEAGARTVEEMLYRIEYGIFA